MNVLVRLGGIMYSVCQYSASAYLQCSYLQVFFYYKSVFSQFGLGGWVMK